LPPTWAIVAPQEAKPCEPDIGRPFNRALTTLDALVLTEPPPAGAEGGSNSLEEVETAGIEPASAAACEVASTSVAGALLSPSTRLAGRVVEGQLLEVSPDRPEPSDPGEPAS